MSSTVKISKSISARAVAAIVVTALVAFAVSPTAAFGAAQSESGHHHRPSAWPDVRGDAAPGEAPSLTSDVSDTDESTSSQIVVGVGLVVVGLLGVIAGLAAAGRQRRVAALRRGRSAVSWRPPTHRSAKTPARP